MSDNREFCFFLICSYWWREWGLTVDILLCTCVMKRTCLLLVGARMACLQLNLMNWQELGILQNTSSGFWVEVECLFYSIKHVSSFFRENISYWKVKEIDPQEQRAKGYGWNLSFFSWVSIEYSNICCSRGDIWRRLSFVWSRISLSHFIKQGMKCMASQNSRGSLLWDLLWFKLFYVQEPFPMVDIFCTSTLFLSTLLPQTHKQ